MNAEAVAVLRTTADVPVPLVGVRATGRLNGLMFELEVEQRYENRSDTNIEAVYTFPVPLHAAFLGLGIEIGARRLVARAKRTDQARREYETAIDAGDTAVLLEHADDGLYTVSLGNLLAGETAVIRYRYAELLEVVQGAARLRIPTVIAPRYGDAARRVQPHQVPGVDLAAEYPFGLSIIVEGPLAEVPLTSPTHLVRTAREGTAAIVTLADGARLDRDFVLSAELGAFKGTSVTARDAAGGVPPHVDAGECDPPAVPGWRDESGGVEEPGSFVSLVSWVPALPGPEDTPLALKVLIDCSGSMAGDSIAQARRALAAIVDRLGLSDHRAKHSKAGSSAAASSWKRAIEQLSSMLPGGGGSPGVGCGGRIDPDPPGGCIRAPRATDFIALTRFGSRVDRITNGLQPVTPGLMLRLRDVAQRLQADLGGTELPGALRDVLSQPTNGATDPAVLLITDGEIWAIDQALAAVAASGHRLFVVAVGAAPNEALARRVAEVTGGACEFVTPGEDVERTIVNMARRVREPGFRVSEVRWPITPRWTAPLPSAVFSGDTVHLLAGFDAQPEGVAIVSVSDGRGELVQMQPVAVSSTVAAGDGLARLAAARRLAALSGNEAAALAERYQLASKWTAFVVVDEREAKAAELPRLAQVSQMLAAGWGGSASVEQVHELAAHASVGSCMAEDEICGAYDAHASYRLPPSAGLGRTSAPDDRAGAVYRLKTMANASGRQPEDGRSSEQRAERPDAGMPRSLESGVGGPCERPLQIAETILRHIARGGDAATLLASLPSFGVPPDIIAEILAVAGDRGITPAQAARLFAALLVDRLRSDIATARSLETDSVRRFMSILGERRLRGARSDMARLLSACTADTWCGEI